MGDKDATREEEVFFTITQHLGHNLQGPIRAGRQRNNLPGELERILISKVCSLLSPLSLSVISATEQLQEQRADS